MRQSILTSVILLATLLGACTQWHPVTTASPRQLVAERKPDKVRVTMPDSLIVLAWPKVVGDSLTGVVVAPKRTRVVVPLSQIQRIEIQRDHPATIVGGVVGAGLGIYLVIRVFDSLSDWDEAWSDWQFFRN